MGGNSALNLAMIDLQTAIAEGKSEQVKEKVAAVRAARQKARAALAAAQAELQEMITPEQEAVLVSRGLLD
jgi:hypothetical protein